MMFVLNGVHNIMNEDLVFCNTCNGFTTQLVYEEQEDLLIKGNDTLFQKLKCGECQRTNTRLLHMCSSCERHTEQKLIKEYESMMFVDVIEQQLKCKTCNNLNETSRQSDSFIERLHNARDEDGGVYCEHCMCYRKQILLDKKSSELDSDFDLTTYKCKTCKTTNYGTEEKKDIK